MSITNVIKTIQDIMRQDVGVDGDAQRIAQLVWMIFLKIFADKEAELELIEDDYQSPLPDHLRWENWASDAEGMTGDELLNFVNNTLFPSLKELPDVEEGSRGFIIREVFQDSYNYMKSGTLMRQIINKINEIDFNSSDDRHLFNDFYESFLKDLQSAGNAGEFYTIRAVTQFMVDIINPQLGEKVMDPACGTGGFLKSTIEHLMSQAKTAEERKFAQSSVYGIEKKQLPHVLATTNLILHDVDLPNIRHDNSLSRPIRDYGSGDKVDIILTNPPFGGIEEEGIQSNFPVSFRTKETADLFMVLILTLLKENGRGAVVLPDGFLFGDGVKNRIKEKLLEECNLHTIVRLPHGVFAPYTGIKTNLLFFQKGEPTKEIWFFEHPYPEGQKSYSKTRPIRTEEFNLEKQWWNNRVENEYAWKVSIEEIKSKGYNLDFKNPHSIEDELIAPDIALDNYMFSLTNLKIAKEELLEQLTPVTKDVPSIELFVKQFHDVIKSEIDVGLLERFILQIAFRGNLVGENEDDEPVSKLLSKIIDKKQRLLSEKKIKREKPLLPISNDEVPYKIPDHWQWERIGNCILSVIGGGTPSKQNPQYWNGEIPWASVKDLKNNMYLEKTVDSITQEGLENSSSNLIQAGNIILSTRMGLGKIQINSIDVAINQDLKAIYLPEEILKEYFYYFYKGLDMKGTGTGTTVEGIKQAELLNMLVPIPPTAEQERIVEKIKELFVLCDKLKREIESCEYHRQKFVRTMLQDTMNKAD
ncbi:N-6 DNA methylase [Neobacillus novalis]|uniref:site-specific DNA-methyltransferase (adenine-specific) n=1 Tax=Neobacillus novalis TaxID=220687 RepID=A0AA95MTM1_9BACI|nr:N-6 DNA methylase [Neobacillus novalis]WHY86313.1 N-6 DNA methylase [Neobacillus novalis]